ncbi:MAG: hypothetical protein NVS3B20_23990 [Polyangiales bacterium]
MMQLAVVCSLAAFAAGCGANGSDADATDAQSAALGASCGGHVLHPRGCQRGLVCVSGLTRDLH